MDEKWICDLCGHERDTLVCIEPKCHCFCGIKKESGEK